MRHRRATATLFVALAACPGASRPTTFARLEATRAAPAVAEARSQSPALWAKAEKLRVEADEAWHKGDPVGAGLYAEHAIAAYRHAVATARLTSALAREARETTRRESARERAQADEQSRVEVDREADKLEADIAVRREALVPASSGPTDPARQAARWVATRSNLATAETLCEAATLLAPAAKGVGEANQTLADVTGLARDGKGDAPIDASTRARALCLRGLTNAREVTVAGGGPSGDALLGELSSMGGFQPVRDERGVVATLSMVPAADAPFETGAAKLTRVGQQKLEALGRVASTHPTFAIVVLAHAASGSANPTRDHDRAVAAKQVLSSAGATESRIAIQTPGTRTPLFDPNDPKARVRNERLEIVFVGGAN